MFNYGISSGDELFTGGIPLHAVDLACNPFDVSWITAKFWKLGRWQNMVKRVVHSKHNQLASVGATVVLRFQFCADSLSVFRCFQTISRCFSKVTALTKRISLVNQRWQDLKLPTGITQSLSYHTRFPLSGFILKAFSAAVTINPLRSWRNLAAQCAETLRLKRVVAFKILLSMRFCVPFWMVSFPSFDSFLISSADVLRSLELVGSFSHDEMNFISDRLMSTRAKEVNLVFI